MHVLFLCIFILIHFFLFALYCISVTYVTFNDHFISNILFAFTAIVWLLFVYWPFIIVISWSLFVCFIWYYHNICLLLLMLSSGAGPCFPLSIKIKTIMFVYLLLILSFFCYYFVTWLCGITMIWYRHRARKKRRWGNRPYAGYLAKIVCICYTCTIMI